MANQIALRTLTRPGTALIAEERTHILIFEAGGPAVHSGLMTLPLPGDAGRITSDQLRDGGLDARDWLQPAGIVVLEQTHRSAGGRVWPLDELAGGRSQTARELGLAVHLDGARLLNASVASGIPAAEYGRLADTVTICFSKGLGCPMGAVLAGSRERIEEAWRLKFLFGGALRQAGVVAAAMLYALDHNVERLAEDHARARRLAEGLAAAGLPVDVEATETNFVGIDVASARDGHRRGAGAHRARRASWSGCSAPASCASPRTSASRTTTSTARSSASRGRWASVQPPDALTQILRARPGGAPPAERLRRRLPGRRGRLGGRGRHRRRGRAGRDPGHAVPDRLDLEDLHRRGGAAARRRGRARRSTTRSSAHVPEAEPGR